MSYSPLPSFKQPMYPVPIDPLKENGFGLAGFIVSIASLFLCGIPSIVGVLLSVIGLRKHPKGFAIAGLLIGLVGLIEIAGVCFVTISVYRVGQSAGSFLQETTVKFQLTAESENIGNEWDRLSRVPTQAEGEELLKGKRDLMGNQLVYETDGASFSLRTAGADGTLETEDDIVLGPFEDVESTRLFDESDLDWNAEGFDGSKLKDLMEADLKKK